MLTVRTTKPPYNALLTAMSPTARAAIVNAATHEVIAAAAELCAAGAPIEVVYFPTSGYISLLTGTEATASLEIGMAGDEGMFGATLLLGVLHSPFRAMVQSVGSAYCLPAGRFMTLVEAHPTLRSVLERYLYISIAQIAQAAACNRSHAVSARVARWMLMTHDRVRENHFCMTHSFLADMLGVRRAGVSQAAMVLQRKGLIAYARGQVTVINREGLLAEACGCYATLRNQYDREISTPTCTLSPVA